MRTAFIFAVSEERTRSRQYFCTSTSVTVNPRTLLVVRIQHGRLVDRRIFLAIFLFLLSLALLSRTVAGFRSLGCRSRRLCEPFNCCGVTSSACNKVDAYHLSLAGLD